MENYPNPFKVDNNMVVTLSERDNWLAIGKI